MYAKVSATNLAGTSDFSAIGNGGTIVSTPGAVLNFANNKADTTSTQIALTWYEPISGGGSPVIDYKVWISSDGGVTYTELITGLTETSYIATGLTRGTTYSFKVQARNDVGYGEQSSVLTVLAASKPDRPDAPTTSWTRDVVTVSWNEPETNGGPILSYSISVRDSTTLSYSTELTNCDGSNADIITNKSCDIPVSVLISSPFNLAWGDDVYAKISATNEKGSSSQSSAGNGAIIITYPDAPLNLVEKASARTYYTLGLSWSEGVANGGTAVLDYRVNIAELG